MGLNNNLFSNCDVVLHAFIYKAYILVLYKIVGPLTYYLCMSAAQPLGDAN